MPLLSRIETWNIKKKKTIEWARSARGIDDIKEPSMPGTMPLSNKSSGRKARVSCNSSPRNARMLTRLSFGISYSFSRGRIAPGRSLAPSRISDDGPTEIPSNLQTERMKRDSTKRDIKGKRIRKEKKKKTKDQERLTQNGGGDREEKTFVSWNQSLLTFPRTLLRGNIES